MQGVICAKTVKLLDVKYGVPRNVSHQIFWKSMLSWNNTPTGIIGHSILFYSRKSFLIQDPGICSTHDPNREAATIHQNFFIEPPKKEGV